MMTLERLESLQTKHANIEDMIAQVEKAPYIDAQEVRRLKREKLRIKEELAGLHDGKEARRA